MALVRGKNSPGNRGRLMSRRSFVRRVGRWMGIGALGGLVGQSLMRSLGSTSEVAHKRTTALCLRCGVLPYCALPVGIHTRKALDKEAFSVQEQTSRGSEGQGATRLCEGKGDEFLVS